jgi:hypothetical protein
MQLFSQKRDFAVMAATLLAIAPFPIDALTGDAQLKVLDRCMVLDRGMLGVQREIGSYLALFFLRGQSASLFGVLGALASLISLIAALAVLPRLYRVRRFRKKIIRFRRKADPASAQRLSKVQTEVRKAYAMKRITKDDFEALKELAEI